MVTTFFGQHSFGGDAAYVDRLSRALLQAGHEVTVVYNIDAFELTRGNHPLRAFEPPEGLRQYPLRFPLARLNALWTHQTAKLGRHRNTVKNIFEAGDFDVVHFHNVSLMGSLEVLDLAQQSSSAIRLLTAHDHWLTCPLSLLWKYDREVCLAPSCTSCTIAARRPPQWWRSTSARDRALAGLDAMIVSTEHARRAHAERGIKRPMIRLPYFLPDSLCQKAELERSQPKPRDRAYFAAAGRLIKEKGFELAIRAMARFPEANLLIAGTGTYEPQLREAAREHDNVHFLGLLNESELLDLYRNAVALVVPSQFYETFGFVVLEAFATATPVIVNELGPLPEHVSKSGGGLSFKNQEQLEDAMRQLLDDPRLRNKLGAGGLATLQDEWSEAVHLERYRKIVEDCRSVRPGSG